MKLGFAGIGLFLTAIAVLAQDSPNSAQQRTTAPAKVEGEFAQAIWGRATDPDGDCIFRVPARDTLTIVVPGSDRPHDLAAETGVTNAPRVLIPTEGDFVAEVKVTGKFEPGGESTLEGRSGYTGAGLVLVGNAENCVTLARATLQFSGREPRSYVNFEMRSEGRLQRIGDVRDRPITSEEPLFLRLERKGNQVLGAVSEDGQSWEPLAPKELPDTWPGRSEVGVIAISTSKQPFEPSFSGFKLVSSSRSSASPTPGTSANGAPRMDLDAIRKQLPEQITPISKEHMAAKVPHFYYFEYPGEPQPGKRYWLRVDDQTWIERYPDGLQSTFKLLGHAKVEGQEGTMVVKVTGDTEETQTTNDGGLQAFIPDKGSQVMHHWYRNSSRGDTEWNDLAEMEAVQ